MPKTERTTLNTFKDSQECQVFVIILKQKRSKLDAKVKDKFTMNSVKNLTDAREQKAVFTGQKMHWLTNIPQTKQQLMKV